MDTAVRHQPPRGRLLAYRYLGLRVPEPYRPWVAEDVRTDRGVRRLMQARSVLPLVLVVAVQVYAAIQGRFSGGPFGATVALLVSPWFFVARNRRYVLGFQRVDADGDPVEPRGWGRLSNAAVVLINGALVGLFVAWYPALVRG